MTMFARKGYSKERFQDKKPKWHILESKVYDNYVALCGYTCNGILGGVAERPEIKNKHLVCKVCMKKEAKGSA